MFILTALVKRCCAVGGVVHLVYCGTGSYNGGCSDAKRLRPLSIGFHLRED